MDMWEIIERTGALMGMASVGFILWALVDDMEHRGIRHF